MSSILSYIDGQNSWTTEEDIEHVVQDLNNIKDKIETLQLCGNTLGVKAAQRLLEPLSHQSNLKKLLWNDLFTGRLKSEIGVALKSLSLGLMKANVNLVELDLSDNAFGPNGVVGVTDLLSSPCCYTLKTLNMNNQGLGHQGFRCLMDALKTARNNSNKQGMNLEEFIAGRNRLENAGMKMLTEVFGDGMSSLKKLVLLQNGIGVHGVEGVENLILSIKNHVDLKILNVSDNTIKSNGMKRLCRILPCFEKLEELHMGDCLLGNSGLNYLTNVLSDISEHIKIISVSGNEIKGKSAKNFVQMLVETKHQIEELNLCENEINKSCIFEIKDIVQEYDKGHILIEEEENSDDEECENESEEESDEGSVDNSDEESGDGSDSGEYQESDSVDNIKDEYDQTDEESEKNKTTEHNNCRNIFSSDKSSSGQFVFGKNQISLEKPSLFNTSSSTSNILNNVAVSSLFEIKPNEALPITNKPTFIFGLQSNKPSSLLSEVVWPKNNDIIEKLNKFVLDNLKSEYVMSISTLPFSVDEKFDKKSLDPVIYDVAISHPSNAVRLGFILCNQINTFEVGVSLIKYVLASNSTWAEATNSILVEMNCIKSEEKHFVPFGHDNIKLPIKVLQNILHDKSSISNKVRINLSTVLKNLKKVSDFETDELLKDLETCITKLEI